MSKGQPRLRYTDHNGHEYAWKNDGTPDRRFKYQEIVEKEAKIKTKKQKPTMVNKHRSRFWLGFVIGWLVMAIIALAGIARSQRKETLYPFTNSNLQADSLAMVAYAASDPERPAVCDKPYGDLICEHAWDPEVMYAIMTCESRGNPNAVHLNYNGSVDRGLFQINSVHGYKDDLTNPRVNVEVAYKIYQSQGLSAWYAYQNECYYRELNQL